MIQKSVILLVDDDKAVLDSASDYLRLSGFEVLSANNVKEALQQIETTRPDLIISDVMMTGMDGHQFHQAVRSNSRWATIPFLFLSAKAAPEDIQPGTFEDADAYITKPFDPDELVMVIEDHLKRARQIQDAFEEQLEASRQSILNVFSHMLRTPLAIIHGYVHILDAQDDIVETETLADIITAMRESSVRLVNLTEDLLFIATIETGAARLLIDNASTQIDLGGVVEALTRSIKNKRKIQGSKSSRSPLTRPILRAIYHTSRICFHVSSIMRVSTTRLIAKSALRSTNLQIALRSGLRTQESIFRKITSKRFLIASHKSSGRKENSKVLGLDWRSQNDLPNSITEISL